MLCDLSFYKNDFFGDLIPDTEFPKYEAMAEDVIHPLTFDRLTRGLPSNELSAKRVQKAVCAAAELLGKINSEAQAQSAVSDDVGLHGAVTSVTAGSESIHYAATAQTAEAKAAGDSAYKQRLLYETVLPYLANVTDDSGVNLLYAGC